MDTLDFEKDVLLASESTPILVDFWAAWCGPCRVLGPVLEKAAAKPNAGFRLVKVDVDAHQELAARYRVSSIPAVKLFSGRKVVGEFVGALPESQLNQWLKQHLPTSSKKWVEVAKMAIERGDDALAKKALEGAVAEDAQAYEARVMLAALCFASEPKRTAELLRDIPASEPSFDRAQAIRDLQALVGRAKEGPREEPRADWSAYFEAARHAAAGRYAEAAEGFIALVRKNRKLDDDGARKAAVALFTMLGDGHPVTQEHRRSLSLALY